MRPRISIRGSVRPSVGPSVTSYFQIPKMRYLVEKKVERTHLLVDQTCLGRRLVFLGRRLSFLGRRLSFLGRGLVLFGRRLAF